MRRGDIISGVVVIVAALAFAAPALADTIDQGYPCATQPPPAPGQPAGGNCTTPSETPTTPPSTATPPSTPTGGTGGETNTAPPLNTPLPPVATPSGTSVVTLTPTGGALGAQKTISRSSPSAASPGRVSPVKQTSIGGTLPFTGIQLAIFAIVGLALIAGGLVLRTTSRRSRVDV